MADVDGFASSSSTTALMEIAKPSIGILSIGEMGLGVAKLLRSHDFPVLTVASGRSSTTISRIKSAKISLLANDSELVSQADLILSIVPPRDAIATGRRIAEACQSPAAISARNARRGAPAHLTYLELNAISPKSVKIIASLLCPKSPEQSILPLSPLSSPTRRRPSLLTRLTSFASTSPTTEPPAPIPISITLIDGAIIGHPPSQCRETKEWTLPSILLSGPQLSPPFTSSNNNLETILNISHLSATLGTASTLKCCFAALTKGLTALSLLSLTTAHSASLLPQLTSHLEKYSPDTLALVTRSLPTMPAKAHRWVDEMRQVGETISEVAGLPEAKPIFDGCAGLFRLVAEETELGRERKRGRDPEEVAGGVAVGLKKRRRRAMQKGEGEGEGEGEDLSLAWRGSWT